MIWWLYALPGLPLAALTLPVYVFVPAFYGELGVPLAAVGFTLLAVRLLDAISDPLIGFLSDRIRLPMGRRRPWLVLGLPPTMTAVWMVFVPPDNPSTVYLLVWSAVLSSGWTVIILPYNAWGAELATDYDGRTGIAARREGLVVAGTLLATAIPALLSASGTFSVATAMQVLATGLLVMLPITILVCVGYVPEPRDRSRARLGWWTGLAALKRNRPFLRLIGAYLINGWANGLPASLFVLYVTHSLAAPNAVGPLLFVYFLSGLAAIPGWLALSRRTSKHRAWVMSMILACATFIWVPFLGPGDVWPFAVICVLSGFAVGADLVLPAAIQADVVDVDTADTGEQRTGIYFALWSLATKFSLALAAGFAFPLLDGAGFRADASAAVASDLNDASSLFALSMLYGAAPVILKLPALVLMWSFPLGRDLQEGLRHRIEDAG